MIKSNNYFPRIIKEICNELDINYELKELEKEQKQKNKNMSDAFNPFISNEDKEDK